MRKRSKREKLLHAEIEIIDSMRKYWNIGQFETDKIANIFVEYNIMEHMKEYLDFYLSAYDLVVINNIEEYIYSQNGCIYEGLREQQINRIFPNEWLGLDNIQYNSKGEIKSADIVFTNYEEDRQKEHNDRVKYFGEIEREIIPYYSKEYTFLEDDEVMKLTEEDLPNYIGRVVDSRQFSEIYHTYIILDNIDNILRLEAYPATCYTEGILRSYGKKRRGLGRQTPNSLMIYNFTPSEILESNLEYAFDSLEIFKSIIHFTNEQLLDFMDQSNTWQYFTNESMNVLDCKEENLLKAYNQELSDEKIEDLIIAFNNKKDHKTFNAELLSKEEQSVAILQHLIEKHNMQPEDAFKQWYHSQTKKYIDANKLYELPVSECLSQLMQEGEKID